MVILVKKWAWRRYLAIVALGFIPVLGSAQQPPKNTQEIPDAPSATRPVQPFPPPTASPSPTPEGPPATPTPAPREETAPASQPDGERPPAPDIRTVPQGGETPYSDNTREDLYTLKTDVNFVVVPVSVKDKGSDRMVNGLLPKDFSVYEDGRKQKLTYFTSDPFPISAAVIFDLGMPDAAVQKINQTYPALVGAFSPYDQVSLYTYSTSVTRLSDFRAANEKLLAALNQLKSYTGRNNGPPVMSGPLASGPTVNGLPVGGGVQPVSTPPKESHVLNDVILRAAMDLAKQDRTRRKLIFIVSNGREFGSTASYSDTLKVLLSNEITVYGVATDSSALPGYKQLSKLRLPRQGHDNLLPKYAAATGGEVFAEFSRQAVETAYTRALGDARYQYTLGYQTRAAPSSTYREIEVRVSRPDLEVRAKYGYYPLPPVR